MIPGSFTYHRPSSVDEAIALLSRYGEVSQVIAGGHSLIPMMKLRLAAPSDLVDLADLDELRGIEVGDQSITIGAMTTQHELIQSAELAARCPILRETALLIADPQVRYCGTIGGNVANGDPGNDMPAVMQCLGASYRLQGRDGAREVAARDFYQAAYFTSRTEDELLTAVSIPTPAAGHGSAYEKQKRKVGDYATAAAAVVLTLSGGSCSSASVALSNVGQTPLHVPAAGQALEGTSLDEAAVAAAVEAARAAADPVSDLRGPADYRRHLAGVMVRRAVARAQQSAAG